MPKRELFLYIDDIYSSCNKILTYTKGFNFPKFKKDLKTMDAVIRNLEIIGEAVKALPAGFRKTHKNTPWKEITGMRDKITHEYFGIDEEILWMTVKDNIPALLKEISKIKKNFKNQKLF